MLREDTMALPKTIDTFADTAIEVRHSGRAAYVVTIRDHTMMIDQRVEDGGDDLAPTPTELFVASLAGCVAYYAGRYLARHGHTCEGLAVRVGYDMAADRPARVAAIRLAVAAPDDLPLASRNALAAVIAHCTVHNSILGPPSISIALD
jgi:putative redox protein